VPVLAFLIDDKTPWPNDRIDKEPGAIESLQRFKSKAKMKMVRFWHTAQELRSQFVESLMTTINVNPRRGWVRAPDKSDSDIAQTLSNLTQENARLRQIAKDSTHISDAEIADIVAILRKTTFPSRRQTGINVLGTGITFSPKYSEIFKDHVAPEILSGSTINLEGLAKALDTDSVNLATMINDLLFFNLIEKGKNTSYGLTELGRRVLLRLSAHSDY
jgi:hypothetical protein